MKIQLNNLRRRGMTYFTVVISAVLIGTVLATYLNLVASQNQNTVRSQAWNRTVAVIEAGIEEALAHLNKNASFDAAGVFNLNLGQDGWLTDGTGGYWKSNSIGEDYYIVTIKAFVPGTTNPDIISQGFVKQQPTLASLRKISPFLADLTGGLTSQAGYVRRAVICNTTNVPTFTKALVAKETIDISGQNVRTDSFDSSNPLYSTNNKYDAAKHRDNGDIAANRSVTNTSSPLNIGNANIYGKVSTGPNTITPGVGVIAVGSQGKVGDTAWQNDPATVGKIKPGWSKDDMNVEFPNVIIPGGTNGTSPQYTDPITGQKFVGPDGVTYDMLLKDGTYVLNNNGTLSGKVYVNGDAILVVPNSGKVAMSGSDIITIATNVNNGLGLPPKPGSLRLFVDCPTAQLGGNGVQNQNIATNFYYFGTSNNVSLAYSGNSAFTGVFYAPCADMSMGGGGSTVIDFSGSAIVKTVKMTGNYTFHYDEALKRISFYRGYILTSWNEQ